VTFTVSVTGAGPAGPHGVHVHVNGTCASPGPHFNPDPNTRNGEWGTIAVDDAGTGTLTATTRGLDLVDAGPDTAGILGRAIVVHGVLPADAGPEASAPPSGCGVIQGT